MPSNYGNSRDYVAIRPIPSPSHVGLKVTARCSDPVYTCESPSRNEVAKLNYERRNYQINACGYRSVSHKPYKEVGEVILDERELILRALGQYTESDEVDESSSISVKQVNSNIIDSKDVVSISQPNFERLQTLTEQLNKGRSLLNKVKLGIDLFKLIRQEQEKKALAAEEEKIKNEMKEKTSMRRAEDTYDYSDGNDDEADLSKYVVSPIAPKVNHAKFCFNSNIITENTVLSSAIMSPTSRIASSTEYQLEGDGSADVLSMQTNSFADDLERVQFDQSNESKRDSRKCSNEEAENSVVRGYFRSQKNSNTAKAKISKSKKFKNNIPRPFSPIFTNVNFYETQSREHTFRQLCALHWILEAMSLDQPTSMPPISTCWNLKELKQDLSTAQLKADRDKAVEPIWRTFLSNPKKFTRGKTGKRGALLQRRVSIAPNTLRRISSASSTSLGTGPKQPSLGEDLKSSPSDASKHGQRSRSSSKIGIKPGDHSPDSSAALSNNRLLPTTDASEEGAQQQAQVHTPSLKEKAFIVREVVVARNIFGRRDSKFGRGRLLSTSSKTGAIKRKKDEEATQRGPRTTESVQVPSLRMALESGTIKQQKSMSTSDNFDSAVEVDESLPSKFKELFDDLASDNALVLHDNLEQREKTSVESMQRKFHALHIMIDANKAISIMRSKSRLKVETEEEKKARFSEECSWYKSLLENLPVEVRDDNYNAMVLDKIAKYGSLEGRKISSTQLIRVLSILRPWELCYPDISAAIEFVRDKIVEMDKSEFEAWFQSRIGEQNYLEINCNKSDN